ncbi:hypothetical protein DL98DRAFT_593381 [Cadophora sp. DSE1049]|nr:hypothetical protein DL98DRAFT_593381 [Cadophora sp. DSE1049]
MVNDHLFIAVVSSTAILSVLLGATAKWLMLSWRSARASPSVSSVSGHLRHSLPSISDPVTHLPSPTPNTSIQSASALPSYIDNWTPQPREFASKEWKLFNGDFRSPYIVDRFGDLRYAILNFVGNVTWSSTTGPVSQPAHSLDTYHYPYTPQDLVQLNRIISRLKKDTSRESALTALMSWIIFTNISLYGSPSHTLLSPTLIAMANAIEGNFLDEFGCWACEKTRVYISFLLCQSPMHPYPALCDDFDQQNGQQPAVSIEKCLEIAARVGFGIHRDLRPWRFSFAHHGTKETRLSDTAPLVPRKLAPFLATEHDDMEEFVSDKQVTLFPALIAIGDASGLRHQVPAVIVAAEFGTWT